jgi:cell division transport system permease protein
MLDTVSFFRIIKTGFVNFWRNIWLSAAATLVMVITLIILSVLLFLFAITNYSITSIKDRVDISVYFNTGTSEARALEIKNEIATNPLVREVTYMSPSEALQLFRERHQGEDEILQSLIELNDNTHQATLHVKAVNLESYPDIAASLNAEKYQSAIAEVNFEDNRALIERLNRILDFIIITGTALVAIFSLIAILVIFNTITLTIYNRREEVEIMRLVGATNSYIRGPFIMEALLYSCVATVITSALLVPFYIKIVPEINQYLDAATNVFQHPYLQLWNIIAMQFAVSLILSIFSSLLAIRRYLKI